MDIVGPPVLSTSEQNIWNTSEALHEASRSERIDDEQLMIRYEVRRTVEEIRRGRWKRIALQFPDHMLLDAPRVFQALSRGLERDAPAPSIHATNGEDDSSHMPSSAADRTEKSNSKDSHDLSGDFQPRLFILADTSYGSCCVDEIAAEHAEADVVVHYGRSCLSPTARLPVIYVFTKPPLDVANVIQAFTATYSEKTQKVLLISDLPYDGYLDEIMPQLRAEGYKNVFRPAVVHDTKSPLPNRSLPDIVLSGAAILTDFSIFHLSEPPSSLLLALSSRVNSMTLFSTSASSASIPSTTHSPDRSTAALLRRRYALLTKMASVPIIGILINTLSVRNYMDILAHLKQIIRAAGKKSYTFVVGKVNAAKVANFSEVGGWVVIGCWESSLFDSKDFWKPVITPWELELALKSDEERVWSGRWEADYHAVLDKAAETRLNDRQDAGGEGRSPVPASDSEEESEPPDFDLRTGRYVSQARPMGRGTKNAGAVVGTITNGAKAPSSLIRRAKGDVAIIGGQVSPAAEFLREKRTWQGLGSDYEVEYDSNGAMKPAAGAPMEQGRSGIARGYMVGNMKDRQ